MSTITFVFFDPWTTLSGRVLPMVAQIEAAGFRLLDYEYRNLRESDAEEIYRTNTPIRDGAQWHAARRVYEMGVSVGLLFGVDSGEDACTQMHMLKGRSNPMLTTRGQLRYDFRAPNRSLSLMHSSDDEASLVHEAAVFFAPARLQRAMEWGSVTRVSAKEQLAMFIAAHQRNAGVERILEPNIGSLFASLRIRIALQMLECFTPDGADPQRLAINQYAQHWSLLECTRRTEAPPIPEQISAYLSHVEAEQNVLRVVLRSASCIANTEPARLGRPRPAHLSQLTSALVALSTPSNYKHWDAAGTLPQGVLRDKWEELLLTTMLANFDDFL